MKNAIKKYFLFKTNKIISKNTFLFNNLKYFNTNTPAKPQENAPTKAPERTPEEQKIDKLMAEWPEYVRNPDPMHFELINLKKYLEYSYKYYQGDKGGVYTWDFPESVGRTPLLTLHGCLTTDTLAHTLKMYNGFLDTMTMFKSFDNVCTFKDYQKATYEVVLPILKHHMAKFDKNNITEIYYAISGACKINLGDLEFWNIVENKLVENKMYRYLSIEQNVKLAELLIQADRGSNSLIKALEVSIIKHRRAVFAQKKLLKIAKNAFKDRGSEILKAALEDPNIEVPGIDVSIPERNKLHDHEKQINEKRLLH